ncbi:MAG: hypothetical protein AAGB06_04040, partial [Verrucomicrobiota bacterium]
MNIPNSFSDLYQKTALEPSLSRFVEICTSILEKDRTVFFPYYTDHSINHVQGVLETIEKLIPEEVFNKDILTAGDAAVIVASAYLHDLAMHLQPQGFIDLVVGKTNHQALPHFDSRSSVVFVDLDWSALWEEYIREARNWSDEKLVSIFGRADHQIDQLVQNEFPLMHPNIWVQDHKCFIGEFIRRHHGRLAHEIAYFGFPGLDNRDYPPVSELFSADYTELIGLTARSHTLGLRSCIAHIERVYRQRFRINDVALIFIICLIRIADFLQLESSRAPLILMHLNKPNSPISRQEWNKHNAIECINWDHENPFGIKIELKRPAVFRSGRGQKFECHSSETHAAVVELIDSLEKEMEISTTVLQETYGYHPKLNIIKI